MKCILLSPSTKKRAPRYMEQAEIELGKLPDVLSPSLFIKYKGLYYKVVLFIIDEGESVLYVTNLVNHQIVALFLEDQIDFLDHTEAQVRASLLQGNGGLIN